MGALSIYPLNTDSCPSRAAKCSFKLRLLRIIPDNLDPFLFWTPFSLVFFFGLKIFKNGNVVRFVIHFEGEFEFLALT